MSIVRPNRDQRLKRLLEAGFFPNDLPPPFVSTDFARARRSLLKTWPQNDLAKFSSDPEFYSIPRYGRARRRFSIINPINHFKVSQLVASEWLEITKFLKKSKVSEFKPIFDMDGKRTFFNINFDLIEKQLVEILSKYRSCLKTDISRYYHTIYTHSIPWALYGKKFCKDNYKAPSFKATLGDRLDKSVRQCQSDQTIGIPVGPDTSRVIGEIIGVGIEKIIGQSLNKFEQRTLRYVDDIQIGFDERESVDGLLSFITKAFSHFELDINVEKTAVLGVGEVLTPEWKAPLRNFSISETATRQQPDLEHYFKSALYFSECNPKDRVLVYAIKRSRSFRIDDSVWPYYFSFLLRLCRKDPSCLSNVSQILIEANYKKRKLDRPLVQAFIRDTIRYNAEIHNYFEISWALFLAKALRIELDKADLVEVFKAESSVCALLLMDLNSRGLVKGGIDISSWKTFYDADGLKSNMWLLVYEATLKKWMPPASPCFVSAHPLFGPMLKKKISFYDVKKNVQTTKRELAFQRLRAQMAKFVFENVEEYF
jgi:hypothetical protein